MSSIARTARLSREMQNFKTKPPWGITCRPEKEDTLDVLLVTMLGPKDSPYENGSFKLVVTIPQRYPFEPPLVKFTTAVYHPNIDKGRIKYLIFSVSASKYRSENVWSDVVILLTNLLILPMVASILTKITAVSGGRICMDMLKMPPKGAWLATITLETLLVSLQTLLANPNPDDPLMMDIANEYKYDKDQYLVNAKNYTMKYATDQK